MSFIEEFKAFALRGNAIELAVGVVMGLAFNNLVTTIVSVVAVPAITALAFAIQGLGNGALFFRTFGIDRLIVSIINFFVVALSVFLVVKAMNRLTGRSVVSLDAVEVK